MIVISTRLIHKNIKSIACSKGLSPLAGFGAEPQKNFAHTVLSGAGIVDAIPLKYDICKELVRLCFNPEASFKFAINWEERHG